jgi:hypothetical protein
MVTNFGIVLTNVPDHGFQCVNIHRLKHLWSEKHKKMRFVNLNLISSRSKLKQPNKQVNDQQ